MQYATSPTRPNKMHDLVFVIGLLNIKTTAPGNFQAGGHRVDFCNFASETGINSAYHFRVLLSGWLAYIYAFTASTDWKDFFIHDQQAA